jgi:tetratricopeptide (TPR) repeat protein
VLTTDNEPSGENDNVRKDTFLSKPGPFALIILAILITSHFGTVALADNSEQKQLEFHRNQGAAHYENQDYDSALVEFELCTEIAMDSAADWVNLGLACYRTRDFDRAVGIMEKARKLNPQFPHISYTLGLIYKKLDLLEKSSEEFENVIALDPADAPSYYSLGVVYDKLEQDDKALDAFRATVRHHPDHPSAHYYLFKYAKEQGRKDEARREMKIFSRLQRSTSDRQRTEAFFEEGPYLKAIALAVQSFIPSSAEHRSSIKFLDITESSGLPHSRVLSTGSYEREIPSTEFDSAYFTRQILPNIGGAVCMADIDNDRDRDLYLVRCGTTTANTENMLFVNDGNGSFTDMTSASGAGNRGIGTGIAVGDYNNDGAFDLYVLNYGANILLRNRGDGTFEDVTAQAGVGHPGFGKKAAFFDYDHDGDLDLIVGNYCELILDVDHGRLNFPADFPSQQNILYRNNGDSTFTKMEDNLWAAGTPAKTVAIGFGDADDDEDTDLLIVNEDVPLSLLHNERGGKFTSGEPLSATEAYHGCWGDFDNDGDLDIILFCRDTVFAFENDSHGNFTETGLPSLSHYTIGTRTTAAELIDFDNDGLTDLLVGLEDGRLGLFANNSSFNFSLFSENLLDGKNVKSLIISLDAGDIDNDGDQDIAGAWSGGVPFLLENHGGESANWLEVKPVGERFSLQAIGSKIEIRAGRFYLRKDVTEWPVHIGLGTIDRVEVLRVSWTNGIIQNMMDVPIRQRYEVKEIVRTDASCPFLFTFDGEKFNYINDILGVSALGVPFDEGIYHIPDPDEYVKINGDLLAEFDGHYDLRLAAELKEIVYLDQVKLFVVDHPVEVDVYPNERFSEPPFIEPGIHTVKDKRHPIKANDQEGHNILPLIESQDLKYPSTISMTSYDGLARSHWIECDLGEFAHTDTIMFFLTGWIYWSSSSANVAISQNDQFQFEAVSLSVPDQNGDWVVIIDDIGLPNGKNSTIPVDLTGKFICDDYRIRLSTNMVVFWDEIFFTVNSLQETVKQYEVPLVSADLHYRGFSAMTKDSLGMEFFDYASVEKYGPWRQHSGSYTRYGRVDEFLGAIDDRYVIYGPGEEISLVFHAPGLSTLPEGWIRDYFFYAFGWIKDGDPNTVHSETVTPLPFRGMPGYPYDSSHSRVADKIAQNLADYLTRKAAMTVDCLNK